MVRPRKILTRHGALIIGACVIATLFASSTSQAETTTLSELMSKACPAASVANDEADRAHALADDRQSALAKQAAELYYDCYQQLGAGYAKDWARYFYLSLLGESTTVPTTDDYSKAVASYWETVKVDMVVTDGANELAAATTYSDVREAALKLRASYRSELNDLRSKPPPP